MVTDVRHTIGHPGEELRTGLNVVDVRAQTLLCFITLFFLLAATSMSPAIQTCWQEIEPDVVTILLRCSGDS
jgi:hypothetical protein